MYLSTTFIIPVLSLFFLTTPASAVTSIPLSKHSRNSKGIVHTEVLRRSVYNSIRFPFSTVSVHESNNIMFLENMVTEIRLPIRKLVISIALLNMTISQLPALEASLSSLIPSASRGMVIYL